jgi:porphobilinogen deaminase
VDGERLTLRGVMLEPDGTKSVRAEFAGSDPHELGTRLARHLRDDLGGGAFVAGI